MNPIRRLFRIAAVAAVAAAAPVAEAQNLFVVTPVSPSPPLFPAPPYNPPLFPEPLVNATTHRVQSSLYLTAQNQAGGQPVRHVDFQLPGAYAPVGGTGPAGWAVVRIEGSHVVFEAPSCSPGNQIAPGQTATFRIDALATGGMNADTTDDKLGGINATDQVAGGTVSCGGANSTEDRTQAQWTRKGLYVTAVAAPASGGSPLTATVAFKVQNMTDTAWTAVRLCGKYSAGACVTAPRVYQNGAQVRLSPQSCAPASLNLAKYNAVGDTGTITCTYALSGAGNTFQFAATADNGLAVGDKNYTSAAGAISNLVLLGNATATFALDILNAGQLSTVRATLTVTNNTGSKITVTPPTYAQLAATGLTRLSGTRDPLPANNVKAGASQSFVYSFTVSGALGTSYYVSGKASTTVGDTNVAVTPSGTVGGYYVTWSPAAIVPSRVGTARGRPNLQFTAMVTNNTGTPLQEIDLVNPQNNTWTGIAGVSVTPSSAGGAAGFNNPKVNNSGTTTTLQYQWHNVGGQTGLAPGATATIVVSFTAIGPVSSTPYPFQVVVLPVNFGNGAQPTLTKSVLVENPIADLASFSLLQRPGTGQTAYWHNMPDPDPNNDHDGVVLLRAASGTAPGFPVDGTDYTQSLPAGFIYADRGGSTEVTFTDTTSGAFNYRLCNMDRYMIYSDCRSGFWNGAGWLDSGTPPAGGWLHAFGYQVLLYPGIVPGGGVGFASNAPALSVLTAANGQRPFDPVGLAATPALGTPMVTLSNGWQVLFAADQGGRVTALDVQTGALHWQVTVTGESFVAGVSGALRQYANAAFQSRYANDVLFLGSTTGRLLALDATTGTPLWTANPGTAIRGLPLYDYAKNWLYVPTDGAGILAYDLGSTTPPTPPSAGTGWVNPGGNYRLGCTRADSSAQMTCLDNSGAIKVLDRSTGASVAAGSFTGAPSSVWKVAGGLVVGSSSRVQTFTLSGASFTLRGTYAPASTTLSEVQVFGSAGFIFVGGSDLKLHKLALADATEVLPAVAVTSQQTGTVLGPAVFDVTSNLFVFGASDGRVWAVPYF
jgi:hypothetical protein